jgi:hypothetical protein
MAASATSGRHPQGSSFPTSGRNGLVEYRFTPDSFEVRHVSAPGQVDVDLAGLIGDKSKG